MTTRIALLALLALAAACRSAQTELDLDPGGDASACAPSDAGSPGTDAGSDDLGCANFLEFTVDDGSSFSTRCIKLSKALHGLCDLKDAADGQELFSLSPGSRVRVSVKGLRVFPATSCDVSAACAPRTIFEGTTDWIRIADVAGGAVHLPVALAEPCGAPEVFFFKPAGRTCDSVCTDHAKMVCEIQGGCLCKGL